MGSRDELGPSEVTVYEEDQPVCLLKDTHSSVRGPYRTSHVFATNTGIRKNEFLVWIAE